LAFDLNLKTKLLRVLSHLTSLEGLIALFSVVRVAHP